jgi:hypothetical protein
VKKASDPDRPQRNQSRGVSKAIRRLWQFEEALGLPLSDTRAAPVDDEDRQEDEHRQEGEDASSTRDE